MLAKSWDQHVFQPGSKSSFQKLGVHQFQPRGLPTCQVVEQGMRSSVCRSTKHYHLLLVNLDRYSKIYPTINSKGDFSHFLPRPSLTITEQGVFDASVRLNPELHVSCNDLICLKISSPQIKLLAI